MFKSFCNEKIHTEDKRHNKEINITHFLQPSTLTSPQLIHYTVCMGLNSRAPILSVKGYIEDAKIYYIQYRLSSLMHLIHTLFLKKNKK